METNPQEGILDGRSEGDVIRIQSQGWIIKTAPTIKPHISIGGVFLLSGNALSIEDLDPDDQEIRLLENRKRLNEQGFVFGSEEDLSGI